MTVEYEDGKPDHLERVLVSCQYTENKKPEAGNFFELLPVKRTEKKYKIFPASS